MKETYEVFKLRAQKHIKCAACGTWITRSKMLMQTFNPWNKKADGFIKSREEIIAELATQATEWRNSTDKYYCKNCEEKIK